MYLLGQGSNVYTHGTIWQVEPEDEGGVVGYSMPVHIRLLHHNLYLTVSETAQTDSPAPTHNIASSKDSSSSSSIPSSGSYSNGSDLWLILTDSPSKNTLFVFHAVRSHHTAAMDAPETQIPYGNYVRIQHSRSRRWIHCVDVFKQTPSHMMVGWKYREVVAAKAFDHNNIFLVQSIPQVLHSFPLCFRY